MISAGEGGRGSRNQPKQSSDTPNRAALCHAAAVLRSNYQNNRKYLKIRMAVAYLLARETDGLLVSGGAGSGGWTRTSRTSRDQARKQGGQQPKRLHFTLFTLLHCYTVFTLSFVERRV